MAWGFNPGGLNISNDAPRFNVPTKVIPLSAYVSKLPRAGGVDQPGTSDGMIQNDASDRAADALNGSNAPGDQMALKDGPVRTAADTLRGTAYGPQLNKALAQREAMATGPQVKPLSLTPGGPAPGGSLQGFTVDQQAMLRKGEFDKRMGDYETARQQQSIANQDYLARLSMDAAGMGPSGMLRRENNVRAEELYQKEKLNALMSASFNFNQILANTPPDDAGNIQLDASTIHSVLRGMNREFVPTLNRDGSMPQYFARINRQTEDDVPRMMVFTRDEQGLERPLKIGESPFSYRLDVMEQMARTYELQNNLQMRAGAVGASGLKAVGTSGLKGEGLEDSAEASVYKTRLDTLQKKMKEDMDVYQAGMNQLLMEAPKDTPLEELKGPLQQRVKELMAMSAQMKADEMKFAKLQASNPLTLNSAYGPTAGLTGVVGLSREKAPVSPQARFRDKLPTDYSPRDPAQMERELGIPSGQRRPMPQFNSQLPSGYAPRSQDEMDQELNSMRDMDGGGQRTQGLPTTKQPLTTGDKSAAYIGLPYSDASKALVKQYAGALLELQRAGNVSGGQRTAQARQRFEQLATQLPPEVQQRIMADPAGAASNPAAFFAAYRGVR